MKKLLVILLAFSFASQAAEITITIPDAHIARVRDSIAANRGYTGTDPQGNPETKTQFAKRMIVQWIKTEVKRAEGHTATTAAQAAVDSSVEAIGIQ